MIHFRHTLLIVANVLFYPALTWAGLPQVLPPSSVKIKWRNASTNQSLGNISYKIASTWGETPLPSSPMVQSPVILLWVQFSSKLSIESFEHSSSASSLKKYELQPKDSPFQDQGTVLRIEVDSSGVELPFQLSYQKTKGEKTATRTIQAILSVEISPKIPLFWLNPKCEELGFEIKNEKQLGKFVFIGISCHETSTTWEIFLFHSKDSTLVKYAIFVGKIYTPSVGWVKYEFKKVRESTPMTQKLGMFQFKNKDSMTASLEISEYLIFLTPPEGPQRFTTNAGLGFTYLIYKEEPGLKRVSEMATTGKITTTYLLIPNKLDLAANFFMNVFILTRSPISMTAARFFGINGRVGYRLPVLNKLNLTFMLGWYFWGMSVSDKSYGVQSLAGPQVLLSARVHPLKKRFYFGYIKFAPIADRSAIDLKNRELAFGIGAQLTAPQVRRAWVMTLDLSNAQYRFTGFQNRMQLSTVSLGIQTNL